MMTKRAICGSAALLCALAGAAMGQATDGQFTNPAERALYGAAKWVNTTTTGFGNAGDTNPCDPDGVGGDPAAVTTGMEVKIPLSQLGNPTGAVGLCVFINNSGHSYASNQFLPSLPANSGNLGGDGAGGFTGTLSGVNLNNFAGNQYVFATPGTGTPTVDGTRDSVYGSAIALQGNRTRFGNATNGQQSANGSEVNGLYLARDNDNLYIFISGNQEGNFNKLEIFIDSEAGNGQNTLGAVAGDDGANANLAGLTFDTGFAPDYYVTWGLGGGSATYYPNFVNLNTNTATFLGCNDAGNGTGVLSGCGGPPASGIEAAVNNINVDGVAAPCPPPAGNADVSNGSEFNALYAYVADGRLHMLITGNLENGGGTACDPGGNKINVFVDSGARLDIDRDGDGQPDIDVGQNPLRTDNVDISYGNLNRLGGLKFDDCFVPDYWLSFKTGGDPVYQVLDTGVLRTGGKRVNGIGNALDYGAYDGGTKADYNPVTYRGNFVPCNANANVDDPQAQNGFVSNLYTNYAPRAAAESLQVDPNAPVGTPGLIDVSINNSNIGGVQGTGGSVSDAINVTTGLEFSISLEELGWDGRSPIKVGGFITSGDVNYGSNQVLGGLPEQNYPNLGNFGDMRTIDFTTIEGQQWVLVYGESDCVPTCPPCAADFNQDGGVDGSDVEAFFNAWEAGAPCGDVNQDGGVDGPDVEAFYTVWEAGGC